MRRPGDPGLSAPDRARRVVALVAVALLATAGTAAGVLPQQGAEVDLSRDANLTVLGATANDEMSAVSSAGDFNGDGLDDFVIGAERADPDGRKDAGAAHIVFGREAQGTVDLAAGDGSMMIAGASPGDGTGGSVGPAGDVNGDGLDDLMVGAPLASAKGRQHSGAAYIVFGTSSPSRLDLAASGQAAMLIAGAAPGDGAGRSVDGVGDVDGDGHADVVVGSPGADPRGRDKAGGAHVVHGPLAPGELDLAEEGSRTTRFDGAVAEDHAGSSVSGVGDMTGDGRPDVLVGAPLASPSGRWWAGEAYAVPVGRDRSPIDLGAPGSAIRIVGPDFGMLGWAVGSADVNGDGRGDAVLHAPVAARGDRSHAGAAHVVYGGLTGTTVDLASPGLAASRFDGPHELAQLRGGDGVDLDGDGLDEVVTATPSTASGAYPGETHVLDAAVPGLTVDLATPGSSRLVARGSDSAERASIPAPAGDVNGDGRPDLVIGAPSASPEGRPYAGKAYVLYGFGIPLIRFADPLRAIQGQSIAEPLPPAEFGRTGPASITVDPPLPAGVELDPRSGAIGGTPIAAQRRRKHTVTLTDLAGSVSTEILVEVRSALRLDRIRSRRGGSLSVRVGSRHAGGRVIVTVRAVTSRRRSRTSARRGLVIARRSLRPTRSARTLRLRARRTARRVLARRGTLRARITIEHRLRGGPKLTRSRLVRLRATRRR